MSEKIVLCLLAGVALYAMREVFRLRKMSRQLRMTGAPRLEVTSKIFPWMLSWAVVYITTAFTLFFVLLRIASTP